MYKLALTGNEIPAQGSWVPLVGFHPSRGVFAGAINGTKSA
jgi:hypothetical protein